MKALAFLLKTTIINYIKRLKERPLRAAGPVFTILWLSLMFLPRGGQGNSLKSEKIFVSLFVLFTIIVFLYSLYSATKRVDSKFNMSDVNLIFVSPIRPQTIMVYGIIKQIAVELLASLYLIYQIPNVLKSFNVPGARQLMLVGSYLIFQLVLCNIVKLLVFALNTKNENVGKVIRIIIRTVILLLVSGVVLLIINGSFIEFFTNLFDTVTYSAWVGYIPIFGWMKEMALQTITGIKVSYGVYAMLLVLTSAVLLYAAYSMELDFYEDMMTSVEKNEIKREWRKGKSKGQAYGKQGYVLKAFRNVSLKLEGIYGAKVLFFKHINEYFKRSFIFFITTFSLVLFSASLLLGFTAKGMEVSIIFIISCFILFFSQGFGGKIYTEISNPFIYLLPDSPQKKLFYGMASSLVKGAVDAGLAFIPFGILTRTSVVEILLCIAGYVALSGMLSYSGLLGFRISEALGFTGSIAQGLLFVIFQMLLLIVGIAIVSIITINIGVFGGYAIYIAVICYSILVAGLSSFGCTSIFNGMDME